MAKRKSVQKMATFPEPLYEVADEMADEWGVSFSRFLQLVVFKEADRWASKRGMIIPMVDEKTEESIAQSLEDIEKGQYVIVDPADEKALDKALGIKK